MKWTHVTALLTVSVIILTEQANAKNIANLWALGASTEGAMLRYGISDKMSGDFGLSSMDFNGGSRIGLFFKGQSNLHPDRAIVPHIGGMFGLDSYSFDGASETHISIGGFGGIECFINESFSITGDIAFLRLSFNEETVITLASPSISVHWYF